MPKWTSLKFSKSLAICKWEQEYNLQGRTASGAPLYKAFDSKLCLFTQMEPNSTSWDWTKTLQEMAKNERNGIADLATGVFFSYIPKVWVWSWFHFASSHNQCNSICLYLFGYKRNVFVLGLTFQFPRTGMEECSLHRGISTLIPAVMVPLATRGRRKCWWKDVAKIWHAFFWYCQSLSSKCIACSQSSQGFGAPCDQVDHRYLSWHARSKSITGVPLG